MYFILCVLYLFSNDRKYSILSNTTFIDEKSTLLLSSTLNDINKYPSIKNTKIGNGFVNAKKLQTNLPTKILNGQFYLYRKSN